jgi:hypothetical protein
MACRQQGVLLVSAVVVAAHPAHHGDHPLRRPQVGVGWISDLSHALDTEHAGKADRRA